MDTIKWTGITADTALSSANRKGIFCPDEAVPKVIQASGPASGTWTATIKVYRSGDGKKDVLASTLAISNATPSAIDELFSSCSSWNISVESVTGTIPVVADSDGQSGLTIMVGG